jgi:hypothetical protein
MSTTTAMLVAIHHQAGLTAQTVDARTLANETFRLMTGGLRSEPGALDAKLRQ